MGHFIFKFLRELNSANSSKSIVIAIILGVIAGFLPTINLFTILIFLIVLIIRVPIGLFIASFGVFKILGFFLDPLFNKLGLIILTNSLLKPVWTFFYNIPFLRWSGFNNTIVMGSLIFGIFFGIVLFYILNRLIKIYREIVFEKLKNYKFFSWLVPSEEKKGIFRLSGFIFASAIIVLFVLFFTFLLNPIIKYSLEFTLSRVTHKKVVIQSVNANIKNLSINIKNMQIGSFLFSKVYTKLDWNKIVWRKYKIDDLIVYSQTNKNIYDLIKNNSKQKKSSFNFNLKISLPKPEKFLAKQQLYSLKALKKLENDYKKIQKDIKDINIDQYQKEFESIQKQVNLLQKYKIKTPQDFELFLSKIKKIKKQTKILISQIKNNKKILLKDKNLIQKDIANLQIALKKDKNNIKSKYEMIKNKQYLKFTQSILKPTISKYVKLIATSYEKIKPYLKSTNDNKEKYIRAKGIYIKFKDKTNYPDFVLVKSDINLKTSIAKWKINFNNISDDQILLNKKGLVAIKGKSKFFDIGAKISYLNNIEFYAYGKKVDIKKMDLNLFTLNSLADIKIKGILKNNKINSKILIYFYNPHFYPKEKMKILNFLDKIKHFNIIVYVNGNIIAPKITINSDLDKILTKMIQNKLKDLIDKNIEKTQVLLQEKINKNLKNIKINDINIKLEKLNSLEKINKKIDNTLKELIKNKKNSLLKGKINNILPF